MAGGLEAALKQTIEVLLESHEGILAFGGNPEDRGFTAAVGGPVHADQGDHGRHGAPGRVWGGCQGNKLLVLGGLGVPDIAQGKNLEAINLLVGNWKQLT